jgi:hypothetical protein
MSSDDETDLDEANDDAGEFLPVSEVGRRTGFGRRFIVTLASEGAIRRKQVKGGWHYSLTDAEEYKGTTDTKAGKVPSDYESELKTLVTGYKELLTLQNAALKQAQQHERDLFASFTAPLNVLTTAMQSQVGQLTERANAGDKARLDFLVAIEGLLKDQRAEHADTERAAATREMRTKMWEDVKRAAPHLWAGIQQTVGLDASAIERMRAAQSLTEKLDKSKVAALFAFDFLTEEEKALLCTAFGYERAELDAMARDAGAHEAAAEQPAEVPDGV